MVTIAIITLFAIVVWHSVSLYGNRQDLDNLWNKIDRIAKAHIALQIELENYKEDQREYRYQIMETVRNPIDGNVFVLCGGCGKSVATFDGFNPIAHECEGIADELLAK